MKRAWCAGLAVLVFVAVRWAFREEPDMTPNGQQLDAALAAADKFEADPDPERLREAMQALDNVVLASEDNPAARAEVRKSSLGLRLRLLNLLDKHLDPSFDVRKVPTTAVQPPPTSKGVLFPPGADPAVIDDPKARANYEQAVAANRAYAEKYRAQVQLHRLNERLPGRVDTFIRGSYSSGPADQAELKEAVDRAVKNPQRKAALQKLAAGLGK